MAGKILPPSTPLIYLSGPAQGNVTTEWYRYFVNLQATVDAAPETDEDNGILISGMSQGGASGNDGGDDAALLATSEPGEPMADCLPPAPMGIFQEEADSRYVNSGSSISLNARTITATGAPTPDDFTILCDATAGPISVNLPAAATSPKRILVIKKIDGSANAVTIDPNGAELIDGAATAPIPAQWGYFMIQSNGSAWYVI